MVDSKRKRKRGKKRFDEIQHQIVEGEATAFRDNKEKSWNEKIKHGTFSTDSVRKHQSHLVCSSVIKSRKEVNKSLGRRLHSDSSEDDDAVVSSSGKPFLISMSSTDKGPETISIDDGDSVGEPSDPSIRRRQSLPVKLKQQSRKTSRLSLSSMPATVSVDSTSLQNLNQSAGSGERGNITAARHTGVRKRSAYFPNSSPMRQPHIGTPGNFDFAPYPLLYAQLVSAEPGNPRFEVFRSSPGDCFYVKFNYSTNFILSVPQQRSEDAMSFSKVSKIQTSSPKQESKHGFIVIILHAEPGGCPIRSLLPSAGRFEKLCLVLDACSPITEHIRKDSAYVFARKADIAEEVINTIADILATRSDDRNLISLDADVVPIPLHQGDTMSESEGDVVEVVDEPVSLSSHKDKQEFRTEGRGHTEHSVVPILSRIGTGFGERKTPLQRLREVSRTNLQHVRVKPATHSSNPVAAISDHSSDNDERVVTVALKSSRVYASDSESRDIPEALRPKLPASVDMSSDEDVDMVNVARREGTEKPNGRKQNLVNDTENENEEKASNCDSDQGAANKVFYSDSESGKVQRDDEKDEAKNSNRDDEKDEEKSPNSDSEERDAEQIPNSDSEERDAEKDTDQNIDAGETARRPNSRYSHSEHSESNVHDSDAHSERSESKVHDSDAQSEPDKTSSQREKRASSSDSPDEAEGKSTTLASIIRATELESDTGSILSPVAKAKRKEIPINWSNSKDTLSDFSIDDDEQSKPKKMKKKKKSTASKEQHDKQHNNRNDPETSSQEDASESRRSSSKLYGKQKVNSDRKRERHNEDDDDFETDLMHKRERDNAIDALYSRKRTGAQADPLRSNRRLSTRLSNRLKGAPDINNPEVIGQYPFNGGKGSVLVSRGDIERCSPGEFLNDNLIDLFMKRKTMEAFRKISDQTFVFNCFFFKKLTEHNGASGSRNSKHREANFANVQRWTKNVDLFSKKYIFVPINDHLHWSLAVICNPGSIARDFHQNRRRDVPCIVMMDSLRCHNAARIAKMLRSYLNHEHKRHTSGSTNSEIVLNAQEASVFNNDNMPVVKPIVPLQTNSCDCGVYLLLYTKFFLKACETGFRVSQDTLDNRLRGAFSQDTFSVRDVAAERERMKNFLKVVQRKYAERQRNASDNSDSSDGEVEHITHPEQSTSDENKKKSFPSSGYRLGSARESNEGEESNRNVSKNRRRTDHRREQRADREKLARAAIERQKRIETKKTRRDHLDDFIEKGGKDTKKRKTTFKPFVKNQLKSGATVTSVILKQTKVPLKGTDSVK